MDTAEVNTPGVDACGLRPVACVKCRERKSYCSKEVPKCSRCRETSQDCAYPEGRKITISESYLRSLEARVKAFEAATTASATPLDWTVGCIAEEPEIETDPESAEADRGVESVLQGLSNIYIDPVGSMRAQYLESSASDVIGRRLSNIAGIAKPSFSDLPKDQVFYDQASLRLNRHPVVIPIRLPPYAFAKRLYKSQYSYIGTIFAFSDPDVFDRQLQEAYKGAPNTSDPDACITYSKVLTLLAFGQLYSVNQWNSFNGPPGFELFCHAIQYLPGIHEESSLVFVETLALVGYFMQNLGQRDAAFLYVGIALRMAISLALHQEVSSARLDDDMKERRRRVWWSVYSLDRILTVKGGHAIMIKDEDIGVAMPSRLPNEPGHSITLRHYTQLSKILTRIMNEVYRAPQKSGSNLMASVQSILASLSNWNREVPDSLRFNIDRLDFTRESVSTFLHYYQCINMTVRPLLFLVVERRMKWTPEERAKDWRYNLAPPTISVIETCISAAQDTIAMTTISAQKNLFATYGYMDAFPYNEEDFAAMDSSMRLLALTVDRGNSNMASRLQLLEQVRSIITTPIGVPLPAHVPFYMGSDEPAHNTQPNPMVTSFPHVNLDELWATSSNDNFADFNLWEEGYTTQDPHIEYDLSQWTQMQDNQWDPGSM